MVHYFYWYIMGYTLIKQSLMLCTAWTASLLCVEEHITSPDTNGMRRNSRVRMYLWQIQRLSILPRLGYKVWAKRICHHFISKTADPFLFEQKNFFLLWFQSKILGLFFFVLSVALFPAPESKWKQNFQYFMKHFGTMNSQHCLLCNTNLYITRECTYKPVL